MLIRSAEEVRNSGPTEPAVKDLVQGAYHHEWTAMNQARLVRSSGVLLSMTCSSLHACCCCALACEALHTCVHGSAADAHLL